MADFEFHSEKNTSGERTLISLSLSTARTVYDANKRTEETDDDRCSRCVASDCGRLAAFAETFNANELAELARRLC